MPVSDFLIAIVFLWLAGLVISLGFGGHKWYVQKTVKGPLKALKKSLGNFLKKNKKLWWGIAIGALAAWYLLATPLP